jgi:hypothetical protein
MHDTVTDDPGSKPDQRYARRRDRQNYIRKIKYTFRLRTIRIPVCVLYNILVQWEGADSKVVVVAVVYDSVCHAEGFGLLLAKGCDLI